jgi:hypothetical protein
MELHRLYPCSNEYALGFIPASWPLDLWPFLDAMKMEPCVTFRSIPPLDNSTQFTAIRFDGSLYFANVTHSEDAVLAAVADHKDAKYLCHRRSGHSLQYATAGAEHHQAVIMVSH